MAKPYLVVAGNIGVGKTTLTQLLAKRFRLRPFYEPPPNENIYLPKFYKDMELWAFKSQIWFLVRGFGLHQQIAGLSEGAIQDRGIYEHGDIFAWNLKEVMGELDYQLYKMLYETLISGLPTPDLVIYLQASVETLLQRIGKRIEEGDRKYEDGIPREYLDQLNRRYDDWANHFDRGWVLTLETDNLNWVDSQKHLDRVAEMTVDSLRDRAGISL